jgi:hypothetical protein
LLRCARNAEKENDFAFLSFQFITRMKNNFQLKRILLIGLWVAFLFLPVFIFAQTTNPIGCAVTGTVIFKEDFGGNDPNDPFDKSGGIPQVGYTYRCPGLGIGYYCIRKQTSDNGGFWYAVDDHTYPNDFTRGYLLSVDAGASAGQFYQHQINDLCVGSKLYFSLWVVCLDIATYNDAVNLKIRLETTGGILLKEIATGNLPFGDPNWKHYGTDFTIPTGQSSIVFKIINNASGGIGNDLAIDDIEVRFCAPFVDISPSSTTTICTGSSFIFEGNYIDDGTFGENLIYRWEYNATGDINNPNAWTIVAGTQGTSNNGIVNDIHPIYPASLSHAGYYRFVVANAGNIDNYICRAMSNMVQLQVATGVIPNTVSADQTICYNTPATLTSAAATGGTSISYQWQQSIDGGSTWENAIAGAGGTTLNYTSPALIQTTKYRLKIVGGTATCDTVYSNVITITVLPLPLISAGTTELCKGNTTTLFPDTGGIWTSSDSGVVDIIDSKTIAGKSAGTATLTYFSNTTGCSEDISISVNAYPEPDEITGEKVVCIGSTVQLSNTTPNGVWTHNNSNVSIISSTTNPATVTLKGETEGKSFITYTVFNGVCQTKMTFRIKVIPNTPPKIIIGFER